MISVDPALLQSMIQIIDTGAQRGSFKGPELAAVGGVRQVIAEHLAQFQQQQAQAPTTEQEQETKKESKK